MGRVKPENWAALIVNRARSLGDILVPFSPFQLMSGGFISLMAGSFETSRRSGERSRAES